MPPPCAITVALLVLTPLPIVVSTAPSCTASPDTLHSTSSVVSDGAIVAVSTALPLPASVRLSAISLLLSVRLVVGWSTVTVQRSVAAAFAVDVAVITAVPGATAVTTPFASTAATPVSLLSHVTPGSESADMITLSVSVSFSPRVSVVVFLFSANAVTGTYTVTWQMLLMLVLSAP